MTPVDRTIGVRRRFEGEIAGVGTTEGTRVVVGRWASSPFGAFSDVMVEDADGHRQLIAPTRAVAELVAATYGFDRVTVAQVVVAADQGRWDVQAGPLNLRLELGARTALGWLLRGIPGPVASSTWFAAAVDPVARIGMRGVRTHGSAGGGRSEWYSARDVHRVSALVATWDGRDLGRLARVAPPVRFGFGSTPVAPCVTRVVSTIRLPG